MLALLYFLICLVFGYALARRLPLQFFAAELVAVSMLLAVFAGGWVTLLCCLLALYVLALPFAGALMLCASVILLWKQPLWPRTLQKQQVGDSYLWLAVTMGTGALLAWLFWTHMLQIKPEGWFSAGGAWGDLALHATLITHFAAQDHFDFAFPLLAGGKLTYPFLIDFFSGVLYRLGWSMQWSLIIPGLGLALTLVQLIYFVSYRWFKQAVAAGLSVLLFLCNGSVAGVGYAWQDFHKAGLSLLGFLNNQPQEYSHLPDPNLIYTNVISGALLPQRSILIGFSLVCLVLILLGEAWKYTGNTARKLLVAAGLLLGFLPFAHPHTYLAAIVIFAVAGCVRCAKYPKEIPNWLIGFTIAVAIALPQALWQIKAMPHAAEYSKFYFGWVRKSDENIIHFWLRVLGLEFPFILLMPWLLWRYKRSFTFPAVVGAALLLVFIALNVYLFQPYDYDNIKLLLVVHLGAAIGIGYLVTVLAQKRGMWIISALIVVSLITSGSLTVWHQSTIAWQFMSTDDIAFAHEFKLVVPANALILTSDQHNHPIPVLTGRSIVMGYRGWLWSYGINYVSVEHDVQAMYAGGSESAFLLDKYAVNYVVIGEPELSNFKANQAYFAGTYPLVLQHGSWSVYKIK